MSALSLDISEFTWKCGVDILTIGMCVCGCVNMMCENVMVWYVCYGVVCYVWHVMVWYVMVWYVMVWYVCYGVVCYVWYVMCGVCVKMLATKCECMNYGMCDWIVSTHHITSHHITSHHITSHHITISLPYFILHYHIQRLPIFWIFSFIHSPGATPHGLVHGDAVILFNNARTVSSLIQRNAFNSTQVWSVCDVGCSWLHLFCVNALLLTIYVSFVPFFRWLIFFVFQICFVSSHPSIHE